MVSVSGDRESAVRCAVRAVCRGAITAGLMCVMLSACGGSGGGAVSASTSDGGANGDGGGAGGSGGGPSGSGGGAPSAATKPVVYLADQDTVQIDELYMTIPGSPGAAVKLNASLVQDGWVDEFRVMPSGASVAYTADQNILGRFELFLVDMANPGMSTKLNAPLTANRDVRDFVVSPDGSNIVYRADADADDVYELFLVNVANPGAAVKLNGQLPPSGWVRGGYTFSPDGSRVLYRADQNIADVLELYMVDVATPGQPQKVSGALTAGGDVYNAFAFSPDGAKVGYIADQQTDEMLELFVVQTQSPGAATKVNGPLHPEGDVCQFQFAPDSARVAYCADQHTDGVMELFTTALDEPEQSVKLNPTLVGGGRVNTGYVFSADSSFIVYTAEQDQAGVDELYRVDIDAPGVATKLNAPLVAGGDVGMFILRDDAEQIAYAASQDDPQVWEIYETALANPGVTTKLSAPMSAGGVYWFDYTEAYSHIVYMADQESDTTELYDVTLAEPGVSTQLNAPLIAGGHVWDYQVVH